MYLITIPTMFVPICSKASNGSDNGLEYRETPESVKKVSVIIVALPPWGASQYEDAVLPVRYFLLERYESIATILSI